MQRQDQALQSAEGTTMRGEKCMLTLLQLHPIFLLLFPGAVLKARPKIRYNSIVCMQWPLQRAEVALLSL